MPDPIPEPPVGSEKPLTPERSLPSYHEPTPETHRKLSREEEAELALNHTVFTPGTRSLLIALFLLTIATVPAIQLVVELRSPRATGWLPTFDVFKVLPSWTKIRAVRNPADLWHLLPRAGDLKAAEKALESDSVFSQRLLPPVQSFLTGKLHAGNEQTYPGRAGWLFYRPDVESVTGPPFLDPARMRARAHTDGVQPDPIRAIVDFRNQLAARGIALLVMPVPVKPSLDGEMLSARVEHGRVLQNVSFAEFKARLEKEGVRVFDPAPLLMERKMAVGGIPLYLETDTHWLPETMEFLAQRLAATLGETFPAQEAAMEVVEKSLAGPGDIAAMLKLPAGQTLYPPQKVTIRQITSRNALWHPNKEADILLLGDSFANVFSLEGMGWGESAGLAEHLSYALERPLDCLLRNSDGAFATREILSRELASGRDRLAGKKLVVWEFAARELAFGNWKLLDLKLGQTQASRYFRPEPGKEVVATGTVEAISPVPRPGTVPYKDHILAMHLADFTLAGGSETLQSLVYLWSMRDNVWTPAARLRPGDRITLRLRAWVEVSAENEKINRSELDDPVLQLEEPAWGELAD